MPGEKIKDAIESASRYLREHPDEARSTDGAASATLVDGLVIRTTGPGGEAVLTDMVASIGGGASAPSPGWLLRAAEASCVATLIAMRAAVLAIKIDVLEVLVDSESDDRGILGLDETVPSGPLSARLAIRLRAQGVEPAALEALAQWGVDRCPVHDALLRQIPITIDVATG